MNDSTYSLQMATYYSQVRKLLGDKMRAQGLPGLLGAEALVCKLEYLNVVPAVRWPLLTKSAVIALMESLDQMKDGIKEVSA